MAKAEDDWSSPQAGTRWAYRGEGGSEVPLQHMQQK